MSFLLRLVLSAIELSLQAQQPMSKLFLISWFLFQIELSDKKSRKQEVQKAVGFDMFLVVGQKTKN